MLFLVTLFPAYFLFCTAKLQEVCVNTYFFYKQNFIYYAFDRFLSVKQIKTALFGHSKTPALVAKPTERGLLSTILNLGSLLNNQAKLI